MRCAWWGALLSVAAWGCGDDGGDGGADGSTTCVTTADCDDGSFCNGSEACDPSAETADARGCVAGSSPCMPGQMCDEAMDACDTMCADGTDADGDGEDAIECGGNDCDDSDADRYPGNEEVCDAEGHDEDCDSTTVGEQDMDGDGYDDAACCNDETCGPDCDDTDPTTHPEEAESCDGVDNDCDGSVDERVQRTFYVDSDRDGYGEEGGTPVLACVPPAMHVENGDDCDDSDSTVRPAGTETCNGVDDDCNDIVDDNPAADDSCSTAFSTSVCRSGSCAIETCATGYDDCDDDPANGCETNLRTVLDCGSCGTPCEIAGAAGVTCATGSCVATDCATGLMDCDGNGSCETDVYDVMNCGGCGAAYECSFDNAGALCSLGVCSFNGCDADWGDCDMDFDQVPSNGCETSLVTTSNCGSCGNPCSPANATGNCSTGSCRIGSCNGTYRNCEGGVADGCESNINRDEDHCGGCGNSCTGVCHGATCHDVAGVVAGSGHTCAWLTNGTAWCWGDNRQGQLGDGTTTSRVYPVQVTGMPNNVVGMTAGDRHTCAWMSGQRLYCWGSNGTGQLGDGTMTRRPSPVWVNGAGNVVQAAGGGSHTCALRADEKVLCWGQNIHGQLGDGTNTRRLSPALVFGDGGAGGVVDLGAGGNTSCAVQIWEGDHRVFCWGDNGQGQIGDGTTTNRVDPTQMMGLPAGATDVVVAPNFTCVAHGSGVSCVGNNQNGQLGDGTTTNRLTAVAVRNLTGTNYRSLDIAGVSNTGHGCVSKEAGRVNCWGSNGYGQLGDGTMTDQTRPVQTSGITTAVGVATGSGHSCALLSDGTLRCWGSGALGKLGNGASANQPTPVAVRFEE